MKNKLNISALLVFVLVLLISVGTTVAYIIASTRPVVNTFTIGDIKLTLEETTSNTFPIIPGSTQRKDPKVTVKAGSMNNWLFIKAEPSADLYMYADYAIADGWIPLEGEANVYYRLVYQAASDTVFNILKDNQVTIHEDITEAELELIRINPTLNFKAYAIQMTGFYTPDDAWDAIILEKGE